MRGFGSRRDNTNHNEAITTNLVDYHSLYNGLYVQSYGNTDTIYKVYYDDTKLTYLKASHIIINDTIVELDCLGTNVVAGNSNWCETIYTDRMNIVRIRTNKLEELGI